MQPLTRRRISPEHMDDPAVDERELSRALRYLTRLNRRLGGVAATLHHLEELCASIPPRQTIRILDVATGAADIPLAIADWARRQNRTVEVVGIDLHEKTVAFARRNVAQCPAVQIEAMNALDLSQRYEPDTFDISHASLFLHHLPDLEVMTVMRMMEVVARRGLIINDLVRGVIPAGGARLATIATGPIVRHDAIVSVQAGFTRSEILDLGRRVGLTQPRYQRHWLYRFTLVSEKR